MKKITLTLTALLLLLSPALARDTAPPAPMPIPEPIANTPASPISDPIAPNYDSVEERRLMETLARDQNNAPSWQRVDLENKKTELKRLEEDVDKKIEELRQLRAEITKLLEQKDEAEKKRVEELAKMFGKMAPEKAASVLADLDLSLSVSILERMKTKSAAQILNNMNQDKATKITDAFSTLD